MRGDQYVIGLDIDNVIVRSLPAALKFYNTYCAPVGVTLTINDITSWDPNLPYRDGGTISLGTVIKAAYANKSFVMGLPLNDDNRERYSILSRDKSVTTVIDELRKSHYLVDVVTARYVTTHEWTRQYLTQNEIKYDALHFVEQDKKDVDGVDILVDDCIANILSFMDGGGKAGIIMSWPHNEDDSSLAKCKEAGMIRRIEYFFQLQYAVDGLLFTYNLNKLLSGGQGDVAQKEVA